MQFRKGFSFDVAPTVHEIVDLLFIDADHTYDAVRQDWSDWVPKVRKGGIVALHDCKQSVNSPSYLGSMKFYDQDVRGMRNVKEVESVDSLVVLRVC